MKNIYIYLLVNGFTNKENETYKDYILSNVYKLPFIKNINKTINANINKMFKEDIYKDFK